jgi:hypothetical protein
MLSPADTLVFRSGCADAAPETPFDNAESANEISNE